MDFHRIDNSTKNFHWNIGFHSMVLLVSQDFSPQGYTHQTLWKITVLPMVSWTNLGDIKMSQMPKYGSNPEGCLGGIYISDCNFIQVSLLPRIGLDFLEMEFSVAKRKHLPFFPVHSVSCSLICLCQSKSFLSSWFKSFSERMWKTCMTDVIVWSREGNMCWYSNFFVF